MTKGKLAYEFYIPLHSAYCSLFANKDVNKSIQLHNLHAACFSRKKAAVSGKPQQIKNSSPT